MTTTATPNTVPKDPQEWFQWIQGRMRILERHRHGAPDIISSTSGEILQAITVGWAMGSINAVRSRNVVSFAATVTRTGATITAGTGNIANLQIATLFSEWRPAVLAPLAITSSGGLTGSYVDQTGVWAVGALDSGVDWASGTVRSLAGTWVALNR